MEKIAGIYILNSIIVFLADYYLQTEKSKRNIIDSSIIGLIWPILCVFIFIDTYIDID